MLSFQRTPSIGHNQINGMGKGNQGMLFRRYVFVMPGLQLFVYYSGIFITHHRL